MLINGPLVTLALAGIALLVWLVRLEGRVNGLSDNAKREALRLDRETLRLDKEILDVKDKADADARAHRETSDALIRLEEAVKHLTRLFEQQFAQSNAAPARRATKKADE